jgi:hypothetical protein
MCDTSCDTSDIRQHRFACRGGISMSPPRRERHPQTQSDISRSPSGLFPGFPSYFRPGDGFSETIFVRQCESIPASPSDWGPTTYGGLKPSRSFGAVHEVKWFVKPSTSISNSRYGLQRGDGGQVYEYTLAVWP